MTYFSFFQPFLQIKIDTSCFSYLYQCLGRKENAPLFPNGTPDKILFENDRKNELLASMLYQYSRRAMKITGNFVFRKMEISEM